MSVPATGRTSGSPAVDPMLATVEDTPGQWARALELVREAELPSRRPRTVVVAGMGGSGVAGDVAAVVAEEASPLPVIALHRERLPGFVGPQDLVVLVSHSGGTRETLACARQAHERGAALVAVTSGGALAEQVAAAGGAVVRVPDGAPPRASVALLTVPVLAALEAAGALSGLRATCADLPRRLQQRVEQWRPGPEEDGPALALARSLGDGRPVFLGVGPVAAVVATRARNQVAENAERAAVAAELPEAAHNQLVGWAGTGTGGGSHLVALRTEPETEATRRRVEATLDLAGPGFAAVHEHRLSGSGPVEQVAAGFLFVDLVSVHLALLAGVDPTPIHAIDELKRRL